MNYEGLLTIYEKLKEEHGALKVDLETTIEMSNNWAKEALKTRLVLQELVNIVGILEKPEMSNHGEAAVRKEQALENARKFLKEEEGE